jgi:hypothetical protein
MLLYSQAPSTGLYKALVGSLATTNNQSSKPSSEFAERVKTYARKPGFDPRTYPKPDKKSAGLSPVFSPAPSSIC